MSQCNSNAINLLNYSHDTLLHVPSNRRIRLIDVRDDFIVLHKPPGLLSVPGILRSEPGTNRKRKFTDDTPSPAQAWIQAIQNIRDDRTTKDTVDCYIAKIGATDTYLSSVPRKLKTFQRYVERNNKRIFTENEKNLDQLSISRTMFLRIESKQKILLKVPESTPLEESAYGQLVILLGCTDLRRTDLYVVHRLDCETSGVMVLARNQSAASFLSQAWRERRQVQKRYLARVYDWPPWKDQGQREGTIDLPLAPSEERLKWKVDGQGKPSKTEWKLRKATNNHVELELVPVTGRTHQLRVHCSTCSRGIIGDSLYGKQDEIVAERLYLHAYSLQFPDPRNRTILEYTIDPDW